MLPDWAHFQPDLATLNHVRLETGHMPNLATQTETRHRPTRAHTCARCCLVVAMTTARATAQNSQSQLSDVQPITMYAHSSVQPMILCNVISRRRTPSRSGSRADMVRTPVELCLPARLWNPINLLSSLLRSPSSPVVMTISLKVT